MVKFSHVILFTWIISTQLISCDIFEDKDTQEQKFGKFMGHYETDLYGSKVSLQINNKSLNLTLGDSLKPYELDDDDPVFEHFSASLITSISENIHIVEFSSKFVGYNENSTGESPLDSVFETDTTLIYLNITRDTVVLSVAGAYKTDSDDGSLYNTFFGKYYYEFSVTELNFLDEFDKSEIQIGCELSLGDIDRGINFDWDRYVDKDDFSCVQFQDKFFVYYKMIENKLFIFDFRFNPFSKVK